jgi:molybdopterin converting factor subunit 1
MFLGLLELEYSLSQKHCHRCIIGKTKDRDNRRAIEDSSGDTSGYQQPAPNRWGRIMKVKVRLFAGLKDLVGGPEIIVDLEEGATVRGLEDQLGREYPRLKPLLASLAFAVDEEYKARDYTLRDDDEVALIPPISGGCDA